MPSIWDGERELGNIFLNPASKWEILTWPTPVDNIGSGVCQILRGRVIENNWWFYGQGHAATVSMLGHNLFVLFKWRLRGVLRVVGPSTRWYPAPSAANCLWTPAHCRQWAAIFQTTFFAWFVTRAKRPGISINVTHFIICHSNAPHFVIVSTWLRPILIAHYHSCAPYWDMTLTIHLMHYFELYNKQWTLKDGPVDKYTDTLITLESKKCLFNSYSERGLLKRF